MNYTLPPDVQEKLEKTPIYGAKVSYLECRLRTWKEEHEAYRNLCAANRRQGRFTGGKGPWEGCPADKTHKLIVELQLEENSYPVFFYFFGNSPEECLAELKKVLP